MRHRCTAFVAILLLAGVIGGVGLWLRGRQRQYVLNRQLIAALVKGDGKQALDLVNEGADPNTHCKPTPVPSLVDLVKQLLHRSPLPANDSETAFSLACGANRLEHLSFNARDAFQQNHRPDDQVCQLVQAMLVHGARADVKDWADKTPLAWAVMWERPKTDRLLLDHGANVNTRDNVGDTPLMTAADRASAEVVRLLLQKGAEVNTKNKDDWTAARYAVGHNRIDVVHLLIYKGANVSGADLLEQAATAGSNPMIRLLLAHGAKVDAIYDGFTPLMNASVHRHRTTIDLLLAHGADINYCYRFGAALTFATEDGDLSLVKFLVVRHERPGTSRSVDVEDAVYDLAIGIDPGSAIAFVGSIHLRKEGSSGSLATQYAIGSTRQFQA